MQVMTPCDQCGRYFYMGHAKCPECGVENPDYDETENYGETGDFENEEESEE